MMVLEANSCLVFSRFPVANWPENALLYYKIIRGNGIGGIG